MRAEEVERRLARSHQRFARLRERARARGDELDADSPLHQAFEELGTTLEDLSVAVEELAASNEALAEARLAAEEHAHRYLELFRDAPDAYVVTDGGGSILELNLMAEEKLGRPRRFLLGKPLLALVAEGARDAFLDALSGLQTGRARLEERDLWFGSEPGFNASVSAVPERRPEGLEIRWILRDVTARRRAEAAVRDNEMRMRTLAQSLAVPIAFVDAQERYRFNNAAYETWFGIPTEKLAGMQVRDVLGEEAHDALKPRIRAVLEGIPQHFEMEVPYSRGGTRHVIAEYEPAVGEGGEVEGFYAFVTDVSPIREAEREARRAESRAQAVLDAALDGIVRTDEAGVIQSVNPALCRMFGAEGETFVGGSVAEGLRLSAGEGVPPPTLEKLAGTVCELDGVRRDGASIPVQLSVGAVDSEEGRAFVIVVRDLRERLALESQLRAAAVSATLAEERERRRLASDLHDDVSQLLTLAGLKLSSLRSEAEGSELEGALREIGDLLRVAHQRAETLMFQLSPPILEDFGLLAAVRWLAEEMQRHYGVRVEVEGEWEPPLGEEMRVTLFRAVRELVINVARHAGVQRARVRLGRDGDLLRIVVEDEGVGFDAEGPSDGFGLVSTRERLRQLGGRMQIDAVPDDGVRVTLLAPLTGASATPPPGPGGPPLPPPPPSGG